MKALEAKVQGYEGGGNANLGPTLEQLENVIASAVNACTATLPPIAPPPRAQVSSSVSRAAVQLQGILKTSRKRKSDESA